MLPTVDTSKTSTQSSKQNGRKSVQKSISGVECENVPFVFATHSSVRRSVKETNDMERRKNEHIAVTSSGQDDGCVANECGNSERQTYKSKRGHRTAALCLLLSSKGENLPTNLATEIASSTIPQRAFFVMASYFPVDSPAPYDAEDVWQCWQVAMRNKMWHKALLEMLEKKPRVHTVHGFMRMLHNTARRRAVPRKDYVPRKACLNLALRLGLTRRSRREGSVRAYDTTQHAWRALGAESGA